MFTLAHLSDPHLSNWRVTSPRELAGKRILGFLSWQLRRRHIHRPEVLELLVQDLAGLAPDHIAVTGDITNISLPQEFAAAARWLARLGPPDRVTVVPGNHDAYVAMPWADALGRWASYMAGDGAASSDEETTRAIEFPVLRRRGELALVGVSTAQPMPYHSAGGSIGAAQLARLETMLQTLAGEGRCRVVLIHHPPQPHTTAPRKSLADADEFRAVIARAGAELVLHGHTHRSHLDRLPTPGGYAPVLGVASASALPHEGRPAARYHLCRIERADAGWRIEVELRGLAPNRDGFRSETRFALAVALPKAA
jgi:3',5'-cyclic AMP phosphodiesterase CpdA